MYVHHRAGGDVVRIRGVLKVPLKNEKRLQPLATSTRAERVRGRLLSGQGMRCAVLRREIVTCSCSNLSLFQFMRVGDDNAVHRFTRAKDGKVSLDGNCHYKLHDPCLSVSLHPTVLIVLPKEKEGKKRTRKWRRMTVWVVWCV